MEISKRDVQLYADGLTELVRKYQVRLVFSVGLQPYPFTPVSPEWGYVPNTATGIVFASEIGLMVNRERWGL